MVKTKTHQFCSLKADSKKETVKEILALSTVHIILAMMHSDLFRFP